MSGSKRSACDHCRSRKVRCTRDNRERQSSQPELQSEPCERCLLTGVECITTTTVGGGVPFGNAWVLPLSRPGLSGWLSNHSVEIGEEHRDQMAAMTSEEQDDRAYDAAPWMLIPPSSSLMDASGEGSLSWLDLERASTHNPRGSSSSNDSSDRETNLFASFLTSMNESQLQPALDRLPSTPPLSAVTRDSNIAPTFHAEQGYGHAHYSAYFESSPARPKPMPKSCSSDDPGINMRLFNLNLSLCHQHFLASQALQGPNAEPICFGGVLHSTSEFLAILSQLDQRRAPPSIATVLALLLCYLKIVIVQSDLLGLAIGSPRRWVPDLHLAGVHVQNHSLRTKVLLQVVEHQFETMERLLGLPIEYRVSGRLDHYTGLIVKQGASELLSIVMDMGRAAVDYMVLLRENIQKAKLLD